jgi:hypothetical protein
MKRLSATAAIVALATSLVLAGPVAAGGWASVRIVGSSSEPVAGMPWPLELEILQHAVTPIDWEQVSLIARHPASGMVAAANGRPGDAVGRYLMDVVFPDTGEWTLEFGLSQLEVSQENPSTVTVRGSQHDAAETEPISADAPTCD